MAPWRAPGLAAGAAWLGLLGPLSAQSAAPTGPAPAVPASCAGRAAAYTGAAGFKLWIVRQGTAYESNPLRPLSKEPLVLAQIVVGKRSTYAVGPDFANLRRVTGLKDLETEEPVTWSGGDRPPPATLRIVTDDGRVVFERLAFAGCEEAPAAPPPVEAAAAKPAPRANAKRPGQDGPPSRSRLPQGAIEDPTLKKRGNAP